MASAYESAVMEDHRDLLRRIEEKQLLPEFNLAEISQHSDRIQDLLNLSVKIAADRDKRLMDEKKRQEANERLQRRLEANQQQQEQQAAQEEAQEPAAAPPVQSEEEAEPETYQALVMAPQQPLPIVDLAPLELPSGAVGFGAATQDEGGADESEFESRWQLLEHLMATRQLFAFTGADSDADSASTVLRVLYDMVSYGRNPYGAYLQMMQHYREAQLEGGVLGWVPQLSDIYKSLQTLGYQPQHHRGHHHGQGQKRAAGEAAGSQQQQQPHGGAADGSGASGAGGGGSGASGSGAAGVAGGLVHLQVLLRLLTELLGLHVQGRLDVGCGNTSKAVGRDLFLALLRMLQDPHLYGCLYGEIRAALEALMQPWDDGLWRWLRKQTAEAAADMGPTHRGEVRLIAAVAGGSGRLRAWQQAAALQLLRRVVAPQGRAGSSGSGGGSSSRGRDEAVAGLAEVRALLGRSGGDVAVRELRKAFQRPHGGGRLDLWRLLTAVQCANMVVWNAAYGREEDLPETSEEFQAALWLFAYLGCLERSLKGQSNTELQLKVFVAECRSHYAVLGID